MLLLIVAYGNEVGLIKEDISRHKDGVRKQTGVYIVGVFRRFVLELRHSGQFAEHSVTVEYPAQFRVLRDVALNEKRVLFGVKPAGYIKSERFVRAAAKLSRILSHRDRVLVDYAVIAVVILGKRGKVADRTEVVPYGERPGRLHARENYLFVFEHGTIPFRVVIYLRVFPPASAANGRKRLRRRCRR